MKTRTSSSAALAGKGFTVLELLAVTLTALLLAGLFLPALMKARPRTKRINCISNIKQIGLGFRMWSNDHFNEFPWQVPASQDGTLEFVEKGVIHSFRAISNELTTPQVLVCSSDRSRTRATAFHPLPGAGGILLTSAATQISYFIGLKASETRPQSILTGDRNVQGGQLSAGSVLNITSSNRVTFNSEMHNLERYIGLADGSGQQMTSRALSRQIEAEAAWPTNQGRLLLAIPR